MYRYKERGKAAITCWVQAAVAPDSHIAPVVVEGGAAAVAAVADGTQPLNQLVTPIPAQEGEGGGAQKY